jgi:hypothetical protein
VWLEGLGKLGKEEEKKKKNQWRHRYSNPQSSGL